MEPLRLKPRKPVEDMVEDWGDDDDFMIENEDLSFRHSLTSTTSTATMTAGNALVRRRESSSSFRSDRESLPGNEERHVHVPGDDEKSTMDAIATATHAGIPIPTNVPPSALMGGTIKRLGGRKIKKIIHEDWDDDLEMPSTGQALRLKTQDGSKFPDVLRQVSGSTNPSPAKQSLPILIKPSAPKQTRPMPLAAPINLDKFRDDDDNDDIFGDGAATIKAPKLRPAHKSISLITPASPSPQKKVKKLEEDDFEADLELPSDGKLKLTSRKDIPKTPSLSANDDFDWGEGSLGTRFGGTKRDIFSARSSSVSALSPSIASSITAESEDDTFDGLVLPNGPLDLGQRLNRTKNTPSPERRSSNKLHRSSRNTSRSPDRGVMVQQLRTSKTVSQASDRQSFDKLSGSPKSKPIDSRPSRPRSSRTTGQSPERNSLQQRSRSPKSKPGEHPDIDKRPTSSRSAKGKSPELQEADRRPRSSKGGAVVTPLAKDREDPFSGLDFGNGDMFRPGKSAMHPHIKVKQSKQASPTRPKTAVSITFTNKPVLTPPNSRLPRPMVSHERSHTQSSLEPVSESGDPIVQLSFRRSQSRLGGHSAQSSVSSIHTPTTPSSMQSIQPPTPRRRELGQKASTGALRNELTTTSAQLLRLKRSLPVMKHPLQSPAKATSSRFDRPPSRTESRIDHYRPQSALRPKTPTDRSRPTHDSSATQTRKGQAPFLPAGASQSQSHHVTAKTSRTFRRHDSDLGPETRPLSRAFSRATARSPSPKKYRNEKSTVEPLWQQINKPRRPRQFGDGHELDAFDDLPTSAHTESKYTKQPLPGGNRATIRNKIYQHVLPNRNTPSPISPYSPSRLDHLPHFARDTATSRMAREAALAQRAAPVSALAPLTAQRVAQLSTRTNLNPPLPQHNPRLKRTRKQVQLKPHLIANLSSTRESKVVSGMTYNPVTYRWEGNENVLNEFEAPSSTPSTASIPSHMLREKGSSTPRPVLITNMSAKGAKRVGDMVFDPQNMCWLKVDASTPRGQRSDDVMDGFNAMEDDDPFKDIPDLEDKDHGNHGRGRASDINNEWPVGEEFDVGPKFVDRLRAEEDRWRKKCHQWVSPTPRNQQNWRWALRDMIMEG